MFISYAKMQNFVASFFQAIASECLKAVKFSFIIGSKAAFFSASSATAPLIGFFGSRSSALLVFAIRYCIHALTFGISYTTFFYHAPTFFGTLYLAEKSKFIKVLIPLVCMILFLVHPIGFATNWYTIYWILPVILPFTRIDSIFLKSLTCSLVCHAVGTIIWLYAGLLSVQSIQTLATIAWIERLVFAATLTLAYYGMKYAQQFYATLHTASVFDASLEQA